MYSPQITPFQPSNIDATTKMLMGLQQKGQLQQYVAQHKNDPNLVALALYVSNMSKAKPAVQAEANQPKIVDQAIAQMAPQEMMPEDQGIATLPAPNMQRMAEGGIVAFADRGYVDPAYSYGVTEYGGLSPMDFPTPAEEKARRLEKERQKNMALARAQGENLRPTPVTDTRLIGATPPAETAKGLPSAPKGAAPDVAPKLRAEPQVKKEAAPEQAGISALATKPEDLQRIYGNLMPPAADPFEGRIRAIGEIEQANAARDLAQRRQDIADLGVAFTEREARLKDRQGRVEAEEGRVPYMALMEAGLAMMSGTSPNAFVNIGAGGATGLKSYQQGVNRIAEAKEKLDDAFGRIEEARRSEKVLNLKEQRELENNVRNTVLKTEKDVLAGAQQAYGLANAQTAKLFEAYVANKRSEFEQREQTKRSMFEQEQQNKRTAMTANAPTGLERILSSPTMYPKYLESQTGAAGLRADAIHRDKWMADPQIQLKYPNIEDYLRIMNPSGKSDSGGYKVLGSTPIPKP